MPVSFYGDTSGATPAFFRFCTSVSLMCPVIPCRLIVCIFVTVLINRI